MAPSAGNRSVAAARITVVIGDDSPIVARGLEHLVDEHPQMSVSAVASDRDSLITAIRRFNPDVVVSDLRMPPTHVDEGIQVLRHLDATRSRAAFLLLSQHCEPGVAIELLSGERRGRGYLLKERLDRAAELHGAIQAVASGATVMDPSLATEMAGAGANPLRDLTSSQREVLTLIAEGLSNDAIAERLQITAWAVEKRVTSLFKALAIEDSPSINRRVTAALIYLMSRDAAAVRT